MRGITTKLSLWQTELIWDKLPHTNPTKHPHEETAMRSTNTTAQPERTPAAAGSYPRKEAAWFTRMTYAKVTEYCIDRAAQLGQENSTRGFHLTFLDVMELRAMKQAHSQGITWEDIEQTRRGVQASLPDTSHPLSDRRFLSNPENFPTQLEHIITKDSFANLMQNLEFESDAPNRWNMSADMNCRHHKARPIVLDPTKYLHTPVLNGTSITIFDILNGVYDSRTHQHAALALGITEHDVDMAIRLKDTLNLPTHQPIPSPHQYVSQTDSRKKPEPTRKRRTPARA